MGSWKLSTTRRSRRLTRSRGALQGRKNINDVTCTNTVEFNCKREKTTKNDGYEQKDVVCTRTPKQDCYNIPRKIQVEVCKTDVHRYCEKFSNIFPFPVEKQNCHFEPKKICELE